MNLLADVFMGFALLFMCGALFFPLRREWRSRREAKRIADQKIEFGSLWMRTRSPASLMDPAMIISANQQEVTFACLGFLTWPSPARHVYTSVYTRDLFLFAFRRVDEE